MPCDGMPSHGRQSSLQMASHGMHCTAKSSHNRLGGWLEPNPWEKQTNVRCTWLQPHHHHPLTRHCRPVPVSIGCMGRMAPGGSDRATYKHSAPSTWAGMGYDPEWSWALLYDQPSGIKTKKQQGLSPHIAHRCCSFLHLTTLHVHSALFAVPARAGRSESAIAGMGIPCHLQRCGFCQPYLGSQRVGEASRRAVGACARLQAQARGTTCWTAGAATPGCRHHH